MLPLATVPGTPRRPRCLRAVPGAGRRSGGAAQPSAARTREDAGGATVPEAASPRAVRAGTIRPRRPLRFSAHLQPLGRGRGNPPARHNVNAGFSGDSGQRPESSPRSRWQPVPSRPALALRPGLLRPERAPRRGSRREQSAWAGLPPPARPAAPRPRPASPARRPAVPPPAGCLRPLPRLHSSGQRQRLSMAGPVLRGAGGSGGRGLGRAGPSRPRSGAAGPGGRRCGGRAVCPHPGLPPPQPGACKLPRASWQGGSEASPPRGM